MLLQTLLILTLTLSTHADRISDLRTCLTPLPLYTPTETHFHFLKSQSFRNNLETPLAIIQASTEAHVTTAVKCAAKSSIRVCARSGGHSLIGHNLCKGLVIDLSNMRKVTMTTSTVADIEPGAVMGEVLWTLQKKGRWMAAGVCPSVGFAGYVLGGGHGPYEGRLGMACDSMVSVRMVDRVGRVLKVSRNRRSELFWALCGGGGGQFGIVTRFRWRTVDVGRYDRGVVFRFAWPKERGGELLEKWQRYDEEGGDVWFRIEAYLGRQDSKVSSYGACYDVGSVEECLKRLEKAEFFRTEGRENVYVSKVRDALDLHAFFGPEGGWGKYRAANVELGMLGQRGKSGGGANGRVYQSAFISGKPGKEFWQKWVDICQRGGYSIPWVVCEMNLFNNAIDRKRRNAFAHRGANLITHYIVGGGNEGDKKKAYYDMKGHLKSYTTGVYINYPELELGGGYQQAYWGKSLPRLKKIKKRYDPNNFFMNVQSL